MKNQRKMSRVFCWSTLRMLPGMSLLFLGACSTGPVRDVAYDPFVPSVFIKHYRTGAVSVAYRGPESVSHTTTVTEDRSKEVMVFDE